jgi:hypothetical protein
MLIASHGGRYRLRIVRGGRLAEEAFPMIYLEHVVRVVFGNESCRSVLC